MVRVCRVDASGSSTKTPAHQKKTPPAQYSSARARFLRSRKPKEASVPVRGIHSGCTLDDLSFSDRINRISNEETPEAMLKASCTSLNKSSCSSCSSCLKLPLGVDSILLRLPDISTEGGNRGAGAGRRRGRQEITATNTHEGSPFSSVAAAGKMRNPRSP